MYVEWCARSCAAAVARRRTWEKGWCSLTVRLRRRWATGDDTRVRARVRLASLLPPSESLRWATADTERPKCHTLAATHWGDTLATESPRSSTAPPASTD